MLLVGSRPVVERGGERGGADEIARPTRRCDHNQDVTFILENESPPPPVPSSPIPALLASLPSYLLSVPPRLLVCSASFSLSRLYFSFLPCSCFSSFYSHFPISYLSCPLSILFIYFLTISLHLLLLLLFLLVGRKVSFASECYHILLFPMFIGCIYLISMCFFFSFLNVYTPYVLIVFSCGGVIQNTASFHSNRTHL